MKAKILLACIIIIAVITSCKLKDSNDLTSPGGDLTTTGGDVRFKGQVIDRESGSGILQAVVRVIVGGVSKGTATDSTGNFDFTATGINSGEYLFITQKEGYYPDTLVTFALIDKTINIPTIKLARQASIIDPSGNAASIVLKSQSLTNIGIHESGSPEAANLVFEVQDANGKPVDALHQVTLNYRMGSSPGSAEYLFPLSSKTNAYGLATVSVNSGTKAGVVEVIAETTVDGRVIRSTPVAIAIYGGMPNINHFYVACEKLNYGYLGIVGKPIEFSAYIADKYSNPVRPGTTVYFETTSGIIAGSAQTDDKGVATVTLLTEPWPNHPDYGQGFFVVTARTVDENHTPISVSTKRLLSGLPAIMDITPTTFDIPNGGSQGFVFTVTDINGNPLASGSTISVSTDGGSAKVFGGSVNMADSYTPANGTTIFRFEIADGNVDEIKLAGLAVTVSVTAGGTTVSTAPIRGTIR